MIYNVVNHDKVQTRCRRFFRVCNKISRQSLSLMNPVLKVYLYYVTRSWFLSS